ncbi:unnamed protein product [Ectocarpus sp. 6 AP-2014]
MTGGGKGYHDKKPKDARGTRSFPDAAITNQQHRGSSSSSSESTNKGGSGASTETLSTHGNGSESDVLGTRLVRNKLFPDTGTASLKSESRTAIQSTGGSLSPPSRCGEDWSPRPAQDDQVVHSQLEKEKEEAVEFHDDDTAADGNSTKTDGSGSRTAHSSHYESKADHDVNGSELSRSTRGTFDTVSDLSCSGIFAGLRAAGDDQESAQYSSSGSPDLARLAASPSGDDEDSDDIEESHITHLVQDRRRWQLRAFEAEYELASMRSFRAHLDSGGDDTRGAGSRPIESTEHQDSYSATTQASANSREQLFSGVPPIEVDHESDGQWKTQAVNESSSLASSCSTGRLSVDATRPVKDVLSAADEARLLGEGSAESNHFAANRTGCEATSDSNHVPQHVDSDDDGGHGNFLGVVDNDDEQEKNRTGSYRLLREETVQLKENLHQAELRQAAAEATIASVTQRARAAEVSREVKEIQIRNLEIRLARRTHNDNNHQQACVQWRGRQFSGGSENANVDTNLDFSRSRHEVFPVKEEEEECPSSPCEPVQKDHGCPPDMISTDALRRSCISADRTIHGPSGPDLPSAKRESARRAMHIFRQSCVDIGARATRAGDMVSAAAAAVSETAKDVAHSATAAVGGESILGQHEGERKAADRCSRVGTDGGPVEAYWGSDYCTSM